MSTMAVIGTLVFALLFLAVLYLLRLTLRAWLHSRRQTESPLELPAEAEMGAGPDVEVSRQPEREEAVRAYYTAYKAKAMPIPLQAFTVQLVATVFSLEHTTLSFHFWEDGENFYFYPQWEDIWLHLNNPENLSPLPLEAESVLSILWLPKKEIVRYQMSPDGQWIALYSEDNIRVLLSGEGARHIPGMLPWLQTEGENRQEYLRSHRNIQDIRREWEKLGQQLEQGHITNKDYQEAQYTIVSRF